jgi:hypothetical protein
VKWSLDEAQRRASGERGQRRGSAASSPYLHGGPNRVEPQGLIHQDAMPQSYGRLKHNFFTTSREVAEDAADMRDGLGHGWIHTVEPTGDFEVDRGEPESWKSEAPLRVLGVEPGRLNGNTPHPPILRQHKSAATGTSAALGEMYHSTPYAEGFPHDEWTHVGTRAAAEDRIVKTNPADYGLPAGAPATLHTNRVRGRVYPHVLSNQQIDEIWGAGHLDGLAEDGLPSGEGYHVFTYRNDTEDEGSTSYLVHRSAIVPVHEEIIPRPGRPRKTAAPKPVIGPLRRLAGEDFSSRLAVGPRPAAISSPAQLAATGFPDSQDQRGMLTGIESSSAQSAYSSTRRSPLCRTRGRRR